MKYKSALVVVIETSIVTYPTERDIYNIKIKNINHISVLSNAGECFYQSVYVPKRYSVGRLSSIHVTLACCDTLPNHYTCMQSL